MRRAATFLLDSLYDLFGVFLILFVLAAIAGILYWRISILFSL